MKYPVADVAKTFGPARKVETLGEFRYRICENAVARSLESLPFLAVGIPIGPIFEPVKPYYAGRLLGGKRDVTLANEAQEDRAGEQR